jgi:hypothetical protein
MSQNSKAVYLCPLNIAGYSHCQIGVGQVAEIAAINVRLAEIFELVKPKDEVSICLAIHADVGATPPFISVNFVRSHKRHMHSLLNRFSCLEAMGNLAGS